VPLVPDVWFLLGLARMAVEDYKGALEAFTRVVQQESDDGRAWGNIGAINLRLGDMERALGALREGVRCHRDSPEMWENFLTCAASLGRWGDVVQAFHRLLDLRRAQAQGAQAWTPDVSLLEGVVRRAVVDAQPHEDPRVDASTRKMVGGGQSLEFVAGCCIAGRLSWMGGAETCRAVAIHQVAELLGRITSVVSTDAKIWGVYALFNEAVGKLDAARDCQSRACRALVNKPRWEAEEASVKEVVEGLEALAKLHTQEPASSYGLTQCEMFVRGPLKKLGQEPWAGGEMQARLEAVSAQLKAAMEALKAGKAAAAPHSK
jgi:tetratricopeptide (TPR) repeat protein